MFRGGGRGPAGGMMQELPFEAIRQTGSKATPGGAGGAAGGVAPRSPASFSSSVAANMVVLVMLYLPN